MWAYEAKRQDWQSVQRSTHSETLPAGAARYIGLQFVPLPHGKPSAGETRLVVFVNNEEDKNEECMEICVAYVDVAPQ